MSTPTPNSSTTPANPPVETVTLTIDGITTSAPKGSLVIRAAEQIGVEIPRFCDHPLLKPAGACRQCLVEVALPGPDGELRQMQGPPGRMKPQPSCTLVVSEGMEVKTQATSPGADKAQQGVMELLLINHPLDCPVCDKGGECPLQNQAMSNGPGESRFAAQGMVKRTFPKPIPLSPQILLDRERCIVCQRCTRFADEIAGDKFIELVERGAHQQIGIGPDAPFNSYFAGNTVQICPVGALTSVDYRFRARPFDLVSTPSVAEHDACGAAIRVDHRRGKVLRRLAGDDAEVNQEWISDKDRFAFSWTRESRRITHPWIRDRHEDGGTGELRPASWPEAFERAGRGLLAAGGTAVLPGGRLPVEDAYAWSKFARTVLDTDDVDFRARPLSAEEIDFLTARVVTTTPHGGGVSYDDLEAADTVLLLGLEPEDEAATLFLRLRSAVRDHGTRVVTLAPYTSRGSRKLAAQVRSTPPGAEAVALTRLAGEGLLTASSVVLVGERLALSPGALAGAAALAEDAGARLAWVPRRAGDRGAVEAGLLPGLLPGGRRLDDPGDRAEVEALWGPLPAEPGRDLDAALAAVREGEVQGLLVGGVDPDDTSDPEGFLEAVAAADFVVSLEVAWTPVSRAADVVLPVAPVTDRCGAFVTWDGRVRSFPAVFSNPASLPDLRVLAQIAESVGRPLHGPGAPWRSAVEVRREMEALGPRSGAAALAPVAPIGAAEAPTIAPPGAAGFRLATWRQLLDRASLTVAEEALMATARPPVLRIGPADAAALGLADGSWAEVAGDRGTWLLPVEITDLAPHTVWIPTHSAGRGIWAELASPGSRVDVRPGAAAVVDGAVGGAADRGEAEETGHE